MGGNLVGSDRGDYPIDGKTIRGSYDRNQDQSALHLISAWASEQRLVLAQVKVEDKSNEITAIPALLELLDITGAIITIDAIQTEIAKQIIDKKANYVLAPSLIIPPYSSQIQQWFETRKPQFPRRFSTMTNELRKLIIAQKFVKFDCTS